MAKEAYDDFYTYKRDIEVQFNLFRQILNNTMLSEKRVYKESKAKILKLVILSR